MKRFNFTMGFGVFIFSMGVFFLIEDWWVNDKSPLSSLLYMFGGAFIFLGGWRQHRDNKK
jgi:hypothetical protein